MFDSDSKLRHLPFFEEIASLEENSEAWDAATAGLLTLRLVDAWLESGVGNAADDEWNFKSVCAAVDKVSERSPMQSLLTSVLVAIRDGKPNIRAVVPALMAYAKALEWDAKWPVAGDVYLTLLAHLHPVDDSDACVDAHRRLGSCYKALGDWDRANQAYASVFEIGNATGDVEAVLQARIGEADIATSRGNLQSAASQLDVLIEETKTTEFRDVRARALAGRAHVAHQAAQFELAIRLAYEALRFQDNSSDRDRVLGNIAGDFMELGVYSAARDAYLILSVTAREQFIRWSSTINLLELSVRTRSEVLFEQYNRQLAGQQMPPQLQAAFHLTLGAGLHQFGQLDNARTHLERAIELSRQFGWGQYQMIAEDALTSLERPAKKHSTPAVASAEVEEVATALKELRELTGVG